MKILICAILILMSTHVLGQGLKFDPNFKKELAEDLKFRTPCSKINWDEAFPKNGELETKVKNSIYNETKAAVKKFYSDNCLKVDKNSWNDFLARSKDNCMSACTEDTSACSVLCNSTTLIAKTFVKGFKSGQVSCQNDGELHKTSEGNRAH